MNKYARAAIRAVEILENGENSPVIAWDMATREIFTPDSPSQKKGCPMNTFLAICEDGLVRGTLVVPRNSYTRSQSNRLYALRGYDYIINHPNIEIAKLDIWEYATENSGKKENSQMDVLLALSQARLLV